MVNKKTWGGTWTEQKLNAFEKYVKAYLTIMYSTREKHNGWPKNLIYFDGFAGSGIRSNDDKLDNLPKLEGIDITIDEENLYQGSCERVLGLEKKFDQHILVDLNQNALNELKNHLESKNIPIHNCHFVCQDVNDYIVGFINHLTKDDAALMLLDPFGMQVKWNTIQKLINKRIDLWLLLPSGVIVNRLIDKKGDLKNIKLIEDFLGMNETEIREKFYKKEIQPTLFGETEYIQKIPEAISKIASLYVEKLKEIFKYVTEKPLELKNSKNVTIFHFIFASNNKAAQKIAGQIIDSSKRNSK
ncbi:MAG: three-Cys-motif partner protein TcmP [Candidatus Woesearchaeota archaeon]